MSSYITALVAGPYEVVRDSVTTRDGEVALGVFCRRSLREYLDADNILDCTKRGFAFFEREFDQAYAFGKYDQVFTPEYNWGAMENAGLVTFNEKYVFRAKVTESLIERRALTILHELAHMWFGNLVTMRWWNDLWLNESFAEWASTTCQAEATQWSQAWTTFAAHEKAWAYRQDQLSTTHPIVAPIRDLADVEVNFDGITYAKGASVLKQLVAYVGREPFVAGLRAYFAKHAWGNTTLDDLLSELEATSGRDLRAWSTAWLETAGVNTLRPVITADDHGLVSHAHIEQSAAADLPTLRPHRLAVGAYDLHGEHLVRRERWEIDVDGPTTALPQLIGQRQPDLLLLNDDDLTYAKIRLDERSLATALAHPQALTDSLPKTLVLAAAWDMTRDAEMSICDFVTLVLDALPGESDSTLVKTLLDQLTSATLRYSSPGHRARLRRQVVHRLQELALGAAPGSDAQLQFVGSHAALLAPGDDTTWAAGLLDGSVSLPGLAVDTDMRWRLLAGLTAAGVADESALEAELRRDDTASGREWAALVRASAPTPKAKQAAWDSVWGEGGTELSTSIIQNTGLGFARSGDHELMEPFVDQYLAAVGSIEEQRTSAIAETLITAFYPSLLADESLLARTQAWIDAHPDAPVGTLRLVRENRDDVARAVAAQRRDVPDSWE